MFFSSTTFPNAPSHPTRYFLTGLLLHVLYVSTISAARILNVFLLNFLTITI